jgi:transcriptional regulator with XRE-family HTH domain
MGSVSDGTGLLIRELRLAMGWSQGRLAAELCKVAGHATVSREEVSRWERRKRSPGPFWTRHLASVLLVPIEEFERVKRRDFVRLSGIAAGAMVAGQTIDETSQEMFTSIASGDADPLELIQTSHATDLTIANLSTQDKGTIRHLAHWMDDGGSDVLRVNAAGILAKMKNIDYADSVAHTLCRDREVRSRYLAAFTARVGRDAKSVAKELKNMQDSGARWCAAFVLGTSEDQRAKVNLVQALRHEPSRENLRTIGLLLNGVNPCT